MIYRVTKYNIHLQDSYEITRKNAMRNFLYNIREDYEDECKVLQNRTDDSLVNEWVGHNNLYKLHLFRDRTASVDLQVPVKWYEPIVWWLLSRIVL